MHSADISKQRLDCLNKLMDLAKARNAFLWLYDDQCSASQANLSYAACKDYEVDVNWFNLRAHTGALPSSGTGIFLKNDDLELQLRIHLESLGIDDRNFFFLNIVMPLDKIGIVGVSGRPEIGVVALDADVIDLAPLIEMKLYLLAFEIEHGRKDRIIEAVIKTQSIIGDPFINADQLLHKVGAMAMEEIGATYAYFINQRVRSDWLKISYNSAQNPPLATGIFEMPVCLSLVSDGFKSAEVPAIFAVDASPEAAIVELKEAAYKLKKLSFVDSSQFIASLDECKSRDCFFIFIGKRGADYLQSRFSETDVKILTYVFDYIEHYIEAKIFDANYSRVARYFSETTDPTDPSTDPSNPKRLLNAVRDLSTLFENVSCVSVDYEEGEIQLDVETANDGSALADEYLGRLRTNYLSKRIPNRSNQDKKYILIGLEPTDIGFDIEVHFPGRDGKSRLFILRYRGTIISESILRSLMQIFGELQVWISRVDNIIERANYLMQVRHAVVHHFGAANLGIEAIRKLWERSQKSPLHWEKLIANPIASGAVMRAHWSLTQARLIIENGRFLLGNIQPNSLDRKQIRLTEIINDCLYALQDQREEKKINVIGKISGRPPSIINGDELLLRIALLNLFDNAIKYSYVGKNLKWSIKYGDFDYKLEITSAGEPLSKDKKDLLFQVGVRGKQRDKLNPRQGTGLGLPVAYKILKAHSVRCELDFEPETYNQEIGSSANTFFYEMPYLTGQTAGR